MKFSLRIILCLCAALLIFTGCSVSDAAVVPEPTTEVTTESTTEPILPVSAETAQDLYRQALEKLSATADYKLDVTISKNTTVGEETFSEIRQQSFIYNHADTNNIQVSLDEISTIGRKSTSIQEFYADNTGYLTVNGQSFKSSLSAEEFTARHTPAVLLDIGLYQTISAEEQYDCVSIQLSEPTQSESWALPEGANMLTASGLVFLDADTTLSHSLYTITYTYGPATIALTVVAAIDTQSNTTVDIPEDAASYTTLTFLDAPRLLEQSCGYLLQSTLLSADSTSSITSPVSGIHHAQASQLYLDMQNDALSAILDTSVSVTDYSHGSETAHYTQRETFQDGQYQVTANNDPVTVDTEISAESMQTYCQDLLVSSILLPDYIADATLTDLGSTYLLELTSTEALAQVMNENACQTLYDDPTFLTSLSSQSSILPTQCYLAIDKYTGLPTASGISSTSEYTIEDLVYSFHTQMDIAYTLATLPAQATISESVTESTDTTQLTPLFYHITGDEAQSLWLLAAPSVGDTQTSILPQAILDAFHSSDTLAIETANTTESQIASNSQLQADLVQAYCYTDSTIADHVDPALYETALKLIKASGNYTADTMRLKPIFWQTGISDFYLRQGYRLTSELSAASQLTSLANTSAKTIMEITPFLSQVQLQSNLSDALQTALLTDIVSRDGLSYHMQSAELYDLWCQGDQAALESVLTSALPQLDTALMEEYTEAFVNIPNKTVLDAAISYLESGETVFLVVDLTRLFSDTGLLTTLADAGYTITQVTYA